MQRDKHKRKTNHLVIVTSDAVDTHTRHFRIGPKGLWTLIIILCMLIGVMLGYIYYETNIWQAVDARYDAQVESYKKLEEKAAGLEAEKQALEVKQQELEAEIAGLNENIQILSVTINEKTKNETELTQQLAEQSLPTEFPLNGSASLEEGDSEGKSICIFTAAKGTTVVATGKGTVTTVMDDAEYGHVVWVDHGNGYVTIYRNGGEAKVQMGDEVVKGSSLFEIEEGHEKLGYQMMKDGSYISPMEMLAISG